jgi:hypothetical protein
MCRVISTFLLKPQNMMFHSRLSDDNAVFAKMRENNELKTPALQLQPNKNVI